MAARNSGTTRGATEDRATFDTSGVVAVPFEMAKRLNLRMHYRWPDLDPFTQGYIEALFADLTLETTTGDRVTAYGFFSDLAPETLAAILKDCERFQQEAERSLTRAMGRDVFAQIQRGQYSTFPPLTATLDDDGKVRLGAQPQAKHREDPK